MNKRIILSVILVTFFVILSVFAVYAFTENATTVSENLTVGESLTSQT